MRVHVYGNSHVGYFIGSQAKPGEDVELSEDGLDLVVRQLGSTGATAWALPDEKTQTGAGDWLRLHFSGLQERLEAVVLVFGEVDCRGHIPLRVCSGSSVGEAVGAVVERYAGFVEAVVAPKAERVVLFGTFPYHGDFLSLQPPEFSSMLQVAAAMDAALARLCRSRGWLFLSIYADVSDPAGLLDDEFRREDAQDVHLDYSKARCLVLPKLAALLLEGG